MATGFFCTGCSREFTLPAGLTLHENICEDLQRRGKRAREEIRAVRDKRKRARMADRALCEANAGASSSSQTLDSFAVDMVVPADEPVARSPSPPMPEEPAPPVLSAAGRVVRPRRLPARYRDELPPPLTEPLVLQRSSSPSVDERSAEDEELLVFHTLRSERNKFGLHKVFRRTEGWLGAAEGDSLVEESGIPSLESDTFNAMNVYAPHPNYSSYAINCWFWLGSPQKTLEDLERLKNLLLNVDFSVEDLRGVNFRSINKQLGDSALDDVFDVRDGWRQTPLSIPVPLGHLHRDAPKSANFEVDQFLHRPLVGVIRSVFGSKSQSKGFCYEPYEMKFTPPTGEEEMSVHGELYWSKTFREAHEEVQKAPREHGDDLPRAVVAMQFWSDGMAATKFGNAKLWPAYLQFGNQSKYERSRGGPRSCHHIAHIPSLPSSFRDFVEQHGRGKSSASLETHCRREVMQSVWRIILDEDFLHAWKHGIVVLCGDGVRRRLYPRIFTYSADYPEKVLLATIKSLGKHPCPRCLIKTKDISALLGKPSDSKFRLKHARVDGVVRQRKVELARDVIFNLRKRVGHSSVGLFLDEQSLTPIDNAFSSLLNPFGFDFHSMLVVDVLHEWEVGIWRQMFTHLVRILQTFKETDKVSELDRRVRCVPPFASAIRRYNGNISEMKQMTAYSFEDLLQIALPAFDGLLPEPHERNVRELIYRAASFHALAKLRLHTDATVASLDKETSRFADSLRKFKNETCPAFATVELSYESQQRLRRSRRKDNTGLNTETIRSTVKKQFNADTSKIHAIGDYARHILLLGTTDSYSTTIGESEHRRSRQNYTRTNRVNFVQQITEIERRQRNLERIAERVDTILPVQKRKDESEHVVLQTSHTTASDPNDIDSEDGVDEDTRSRYHIGKKGKPFTLPDWLGEYRFDHATEGFSRLLADHLLARLKNFDSADDDIEFTEQERRNLVIVNEKLYTHNRLQVNYTTYDLQRKHDSINPRSSTTDVMLVSRDLDEFGKPAFWYARVIGIYHAVAYLKTDVPSIPSRIDFLWVRWFGRAIEDKFGDEACSLERVRFVTKEDNSPPFGFLDPSCVVRAAHLIPAFRFADRDTFMHHRGGGVGHTTGFNSKEANGVPSNLYDKLGVQVCEDTADDNVAEAPEDVESLFQRLELAEEGEDDVEGEGGEDIELIQHSDDEEADEFDYCTNGDEDDSDEADGCPENVVLDDGELD